MSEFTPDEGFGIFEGAASSTIHRRLGNTELSPADAQLVENTVGASISANSARAYASDWKGFVRWCEAKGYSPMPASSSVVILYLREKAETVKLDGTYAYSVATLVRWASSINQRHIQANVTPPKADERVMRALKAIRNMRGSGQRRVAPLMTDELKNILRAAATDDWPDAVFARRDAAILLVGYAGAFRRSELASLNIADAVPEIHDGFHLHLRRSKTDQQGRGQVKALPYGADAVTCGPCALGRWLDIVDAADRGEGRAGVMRVISEAPPLTEHVCRNTPRKTRYAERPLFRSISTGGTVKTNRLSGQGINEVIKRRVQAVGLNPRDFGGHSLRAGFVTQAFRSGADSRSIRRQTGHKGDAILDIYDRENAPMANNAVTRIGL